MYFRQARLDHSKAKTVFKANLRRNHWNDTMLRISAGYCLQIIVHRNVWSQNSQFVFVTDNLVAIVHGLT
jgi:hypothetical protein